MYLLDYIDLGIENLAGSWKSLEYPLGTIMNASITSDPNSTVNFKDSQTLLAAFTMIRASDGYTNGSLAWGAHGTTPTAMECGLSLCLKLYQSSVSSGNLSDEVIASASTKVPGSWLPRPQDEQIAKESLAKASDSILGTLAWNPVYHPIYLVRDDYQLEATSLSSSPNSTYNITQKAIDSTIAYINGLIPRMVNQSTVNITTVLNPVYGTPILQPLYDSRDLTVTFEKIAMSLSNALRRAGTEPLRGTTQNWVIHYEIRWIWLVLPVTLLLCKFNPSIID